MSTATPAAGPTSSETVEAVETVPAVEMVEAIDTSNWTTFTSDVYDLQIGHPPGWTETPATRTWRLDTDGTESITPAADGLPAPRRVTSS